MSEVVQLQVTATAEVEVTKAASIRQWRIRGVFEDDMATVQVGNNAVYICTAVHVHNGRGSEMNPTCMLRPESARELARALIAAADKSTPTDEEHP